MNREEAITTLGDRNNLLWGMSNEEKKYYSEALDMAISALQKNESAEEWYKLLCEKWDSAEGEYIKKEDAIQAYEDTYKGKGSFYGLIEQVPTYSFPKREKEKQLYSDLLRVKHNTMSIDSLIDKVYEDMRGK